MNTYQTNRHLKTKWRWDTYQRHSGERDPYVLPWVRGTLCREQITLGVRVSCCVYVHRWWPTIRTTIRSWYKQKIEQEINTRLKVRYKRPKLSWKNISKSPIAFCFSTKNAVWVQRMHKLSEIFSETNRKTARKARLNHICSTSSRIQPKNRAAQCARCLFMFLLAVSSHNHIVLKIE